MMVETVSLTRIAPEALIDRPARLARATLRDGVVAACSAQIRDGAIFPPVVAFTDGAGYWLADSRHRLEAHRAARPGGPIECEMREGDELAALRFALVANGRHSAQRSSEDLRAAFEAAVTELLQYSSATAYRLTEPARAASRRQRDDRISGLHEEGRSQREIAGPHRRARPGLLARYPLAPWRRSGASCAACRSWCTSTSFASPAPCHLVTAHAFADQSRSCIRGAGRTWPPRRSCAKPRAVPAPSATEPAANGTAREVHDDR